MSFYEIFLVKIKDICGGEAKSRAELDELFDKQGLAKTQLDAWLKKAVDENKVEKTRKPIEKARGVRYRWAASQ